MIESALLYNYFLSTTLSDLAFKLNPYLQSIANKAINEQKCTIRWFVENNKVSHMDDGFNSMIADKIEEKIGKLSITTEKKHMFLDMDIYFIGRKKVAVSMPYHIDEDLEHFGGTLKGKVVIPATSQLITITSEAKELDYETGSVITQ